MSHTATNIERLGRHTHLVSGNSSYLKSDHKYIEMSEVTQPRLDCFGLKVGTNLYRFIEDEVVPGLLNQAAKRDDLPIRTICRIFLVKSFGRDLPILYAI